MLVEQLDPVERRPHWLQGDLTVQSSQPLGRDLDLRPTDGALVKQRLAGEVRQLHVIAVGEDDCSDTRCDQGRGEIRANPAGADEADGGAGQHLLGLRAVGPDQVVVEEVAGVATGRIQVVSGQHARLEQLAEQLPCLILVEVCQAHGVRDRLVSGAGYREVGEKLWQAGRSVLYFDRARGKGSDEDVAV